MFWKTKEDLIAIYEEQMGKRYFGEQLIKLDAMILKKSQSILPQVLTSNKLQVGAVVAVEVNRETFKILFEENVVYEKGFDHQEVFDMLDVLGFIDSDVKDVKFYTILTYPNALKSEVEELHVRYNGSLIRPLTAEQVGLRDFDLSGTLFEDSFEKCMSVFAEFAKLREKATDRDRCLFNTFANIDPADFQFYYE